MADDTSASTTPALQPIARPLNLIPVTLKEAALDSPTFRATVSHFADQIDLIERWLETYLRSTTSLLTELSKFESAVNTFLTQSSPPAQVSEAVLDHDYTLLAMRRYGEGARVYWDGMLKGVKRYEGAVVEPIRAFLNNELRGFKEARRGLEATQKTFDHVLNRYLSQSKTKEASSLREDAFQLHSARTAYLKASLDFCISAPNLRASLDKMVVRIFSDQLKDMRSSRETNAAAFTKSTTEMERVRGWSRELENSERAFKRELQSARQQIESTAIEHVRPSRELEDYAASTVPYLGTGAASTPAKPPQQERSEKQGWLFIKTIVGKPARTVWSRRWFYVKNGIFGWLLQGARSGGVEESERIGVLLCSVRPAFQEERRFCFEIKTKDQSIILQAETQAELTEWIEAFDVAKRKALEAPASTTETSPLEHGIDPAFAISPPVAPEFAAKTADTHPMEENNAPAAEITLGGGPASRSSFDVSSSQLPPSAARRVLSLERQEGEGNRDHAARIIQKLDLHKRLPASPQSSQSSGIGAGGMGGIASLISASHNVLPVGPGAPPPLSAGPETARRTFTLPSTTLATSTLAPSTLANPPASTNLSHTAVVVSGERGLGLGKGSADGSGMPSGIMANLWGSQAWGYVNRLGDEGVGREDEQQPGRTGSRSVSPGTVRSLGGSVDDVGIMDGQQSETSTGGLATLGTEGLKHRKTLSVATDQPLSPPTTSAAASDVDDYPNYYPLPLKAQQAQFRMLFPSVPRKEKVLLVFRASWNPNEQQEFPGRVYVTEKEIYFYSNHLGLVLITSVSLRSVGEVTAAPGRDCDYVYLHLRSRSQELGMSEVQGMVEQEDEARRVTVKVFLEPLKLLQRRLNFLVHNARAESPEPLDEVLKRLIKMEVDVPQRSSSVESWEDITFSDPDATTGASGEAQRSPGRKERNIKTSLRIDGTLYGDAGPRTGREIHKFKLPAQPVVYAPQNMHRANVSREFNVSAKALFHVMFGDKSAVFQLLYCNRWDDRITQAPWTKGADGHWTRKFESQGKVTPMQEEQRIDILNDHLCYVTTVVKKPWKLPYASRYTPTTKIVITHTSKSRCKLAVFQALHWSKPPAWSYIRGLIEKQALNALEADALDLTNVAFDQVAKLGSHSKTNRAVEIFGNIGQIQQAAVPQIDAAVIPKLGGNVSKSQPKPVGLVKLVVDDILERLLAWIGWVLDVLMAAAKALIGVFTTHTLLVALLAVSALYNGWYGYRDGVSWWHERSATRFMSRVGVGPAPAAIGKAIYLRDIDSLISPPSLGAENETLASMLPSNEGEAKTCRTTFTEQLVTSPSLPAAGGRGSGGAHLRRTRDSLARYRHDLLVALRVVNRVERDVVTAEWEEWVKGEEQKCRRVEGMLKKQQQSQNGGKGKVKEVEVDTELGEDYAGYCQSCRREVEGLGNGTSSLI